MAKGEGGGGEDVVIRRKVPERKVGGMVSGEVFRKGGINRNGMTAVEGWMSFRVRIWHFTPQTGRSRPICRVPPLRSPENATVWSTTNSFWSISAFNRWSKSCCWECAGWTKGCREFGEGSGRGGRGDPSETVHWAQKGTSWRHWCPRTTWRATGRRPSGGWNCCRWCSTCPCCPPQCGCSFTTIGTVPWGTIRVDNRTWSVGGELWRVGEGKGMGRDGGGERKRVIADEGEK